MEELETLSPPPENEGPDEPAGGPPTDAGTPAEPEAPPAAIEEPVSAEELLGSGQSAPPPSLSVEDAQLRAVLEAVVYVADEPLTLQQICTALQEPPAEIAAGCPLAVLDDKDSCLLARRTKHAHLHPPHTP